MKTDPTGAFLRSRQVAVIEDKNAQAIGASLAKAVQPARSETPVRQFLSHKKFLGAYGDAGRVVT